MSRSVHTRPRAIRAASRLRAPREKRGARDLSSRRRVARALKELGVVATPPATGTDKAAPLPRVVVRQSRRGYYHPARKADVERVLRFFGEACYYGVRRVELVPLRTAPGRTWHPLGRLFVPGRIVLYEQPRDPWILPGKLPAEDERQLQRAGAIIETCPSRMSTTVTWPGDTLRDFMCLDVLMHEVGHHIVQHYKGKRRPPAARTRDHEAFATRFARRCRLAYLRREDRA